MALNKISDFFLFLNDLEAISFMKKEKLSSFWKLAICYFLMGAIITQNKYIDVAKVMGLAR